ncbi:endothelin-2 isoform X2 [Dendrobates tinctorius]|uniref:endothelin-2 isoform X2 n=1 Tax=Dendrobates tinctorius TaxID=92724 RepID=UPI003CC9CE4E
MLGAGCAAMVLAVAAVATISPSDISPAVPPGSHTRVKRCSCNNWMDKECIYFCHLDIIWINTGSQMLPYGLGNAGRRRKRASARCHCADVKDTTCNSFCQNPASYFNIRNLLQHFLQDRGLCLYQKLKVGIDKVMMKVEELPDSVL